MFFGTDGIRGIAGETLTTDVAYKLGFALAFFYGKGAKALIGRDNRESGECLQNALVSGLLNGGVDVFLLGKCSSPCVSFLLQNKKIFNFGVMITASHNSSEFNGLKVFNFKGEKTSNKTEKTLEELMQKTAYKTTNFGALVQAKTYVQTYIDYVCDGVNLCNFEHKIVFDCANGGASEICKKVVKKLGLNAKIINTKQNGKYINKNCGATNASALSKNVIKENAICGFAFDGDADRLTMVNKFGKKVDGDALMFLLAKILGVKKMIATEISNFGLEKSLASFGIKVERVKVGDKNVYVALKKQHLQFGGEKSGHLIFMPNPCGDGLKNAILLLNEICKNKNLICESLSEFKKFPTFEKNYYLEQTQIEKILKDKSFKKIIEKCEQYLAKNGRILVRKSGTESCLRVLVESESEFCAKNVQKEIDHFVLSFIDLN